MRLSSERMSSAGGYPASGRFLLFPGRLLFPPFLIAAHVADRTGTQSFTMFLHVHGFIDNLFFSGSRLFLPVHHNPSLVHSDRSSRAESPGRTGRCEYFTLILLLLLPEKIPAGSPAAAAGIRALPGRSDSGIHRWSRKGSAARSYPSVLSL